MNRVKLNENLNNFKIYTKMKKSLFVAAVAALALVACKKETTETASSLDSAAVATVDSAASVVDSAATVVDSAATVAADATGKVATDAAEVATDAASNAADAAKDAVKEATK